MTDEESRKVVYVTIRDVDGDLVGEGDTLEEAWKSIDKQVQAKAFSAQPGRYGWWHNLIRKLLREKR